MDRDGTVVAATDPADVGESRSGEAWFQAVRAQQTVQFEDVAGSYQTSGGPVVAFAAPIKGPNGLFLGVVRSHVALSALEDVVWQTVNLYEMQFETGRLEWQFLTLDGSLIADSLLREEGKVNLRQLGLPSARLSDSAKPGFVEELHYRRQLPVVTGYARTDGYGDFPGMRWGILVRMDRDDILAPIRFVLWKLGLVGAVVWVPMVALLLWATGRLRREWAQAQQESERARAAEVSLRESEERTRSIVETALDAVIVMDAEGRVVEWNSQAETIFGWPRQEVIGKRLSTTIIPPQYRDAHERGLRRFLATGEGPLVNKRVEVIACHQRGHEFPVELTIAPARHGATYTFSAFVRDITQHKQAENRQAAQVAISLILAESRTLHEAAPRLLRAVCDTMGWELGAMWHVDRAAARLRCEAVWHGATVDAKEFMALTQGSTFASGVGLPGRVWAGGEPAWISDVAADANFPRLQMAAKTGLHGAFGFPIKKGGETLGVLEFFSREIRQPDASLLQMMADIGVKIGQFVERILLEEQLRQAQKMEAVGQLAGGIAHDFNNLLTVIAGYCHLLLKRVGPDSPLRGVIQEIQKAGDRAAGLTGQLLAFSRQQVLAPKVLDFNEVVAGLEAMLRRLIGENIALVVEPGAALGHVKADPGQIEQVIMNLAVNARDAMPKGGRLTIKMANVELGETDPSQSVVTRPGRYVMLAVSDTGHGMDAETQARIFDPFFTTKDKSKGTGLGLSMVYGIVKQSGGYIFVRSDLQQGTTFTIYLPRVMEDVTVAESGRVAGELCRGAETILLVEDEGTIRTLAGKVLRSYGYDVLEAREADEALQISRQHGAPIHLLLTDVVMPGVSGRELVERLAPVRPEMKVLYMSGYTDDVIVHHGVSGAGTAFLQKPFTPDALVRRVREVLDAPQPR
ncbi:MAG: PAS domain S-box protein [Nitrospirae bacterium]|nr:MAG: PAS domain S-box protein [Nitrospirota bacterium]